MLLFLHLLKNDFADRKIAVFLRSLKRSGSSAWLEYMPVTHGVAGSSPVRTARKKELILKKVNSFFVDSAHNLLTTICHSCEESATICFARFLTFSHFFIFL